MIYRTDLIDIIGPMFSTFLACDTPKLAAKFGDIPMQPSLCEYSSNDKIIQVKLVIYLKLKINILN